MTTKLNETLMMLKLVLFYNSKFIVMLVMLKLTNIAHAFSKLTTDTTTSIARGCIVFETSSS